MNGFDLNRLAIAGLVSCAILGSAWEIGRLAVPDSFPVRSAFAAEEQPQKLDMSSADLTKGKAIAAQQCGLCHSFEPNASEKIGPSLVDIKERQIASLPNYNYSDSLKEHQKERWTVEEMNLWLKNPRAFAPATLMAYIGLTSDEDRKNVIAYLNSLSSKPAPSVTVKEDQKNQENMANKKSGK